MVLCFRNIFQKSRFQSVAELRRKQARSFELSIFKSGERFRFFSFFEAKGLSSYLRMRVLVQAGHQMPCYVSCFVKKKLSLWSFSKHANMYCTFLHEKVFGTCYEKISFPQFVLLPLAFAFWTWMHWYFSHHKNPGGVKINKRKFWRFSMIHRYF